MPDEQAIFDAARDIVDPAARSAYLEAACGLDGLLRGRVEALLRAHEQADSFLNEPLDVGLGEARIDLADAFTSPGAVIGRYTLLERIGEGGYGVVYKAEQTRPIRRTVALKIVKAGMDTRQVIARFEAERQALAMMDHPNIARVFDAGVTETGRPYFVMELVEGTPITKYCDAHRLTPPQRLELFVSVCQAVQHAHQKGIIHRDLKPTNVLVAPCDGRPVPKVIDFGVAKATGQRLTEQSLHTGLGDVIGTPQYMSPEQAELNQLDVDTRSDIYSLGVLLYELLTGTTPIEHKRVKEAALLEVLRVIREEEPPRPSTRLSAVAELASIAANRGVEPKKLNGLVKGELDWIVMRALEKERSRRYETANGLARDVERYLRDEPVQACPPTLRYRLRKLGRRYRAPLAVGAAFVLLLAAGTVVSTWQAVRATRAEQEQGRLRQQAQTEAAKATAVSEFLQQMLESANAGSGSKGAYYTVQQLLNDMSVGLGNQLEAQPAVEAELRGTIGRAYRRFGDAGRALPHLERALALQRRVHGEQHEAYAGSLIDYAWGLAQAGKDLEQPQRVREAEQRTREALEIYRAQGTTGKRRIWALRSLMQFQSALGRVDDAIRTADEALEAARQSGRIESSEVATILHKLSDCRVAQGRHDEAERLVRQSLELSRRVNGNTHTETAWALRKLGALLETRGDLVGASSMHREALTIFAQQYGPNHATVGWSVASLLSVLTRMGNDPEETVESLTKEFAGSAGVNNLIAWSLIARGPDSRNPPLALKLATRAVQLEPQSPSYINTLGIARYRTGDWSGAVDALQKSVELGGGYCSDFFFLAMAHWQLRDKEEARKWLARAMQWVDKNNPQDPELRAFRAEAEALINDNPQQPAATRIATTRAAK